jgi:uncharacterized protein (TIGR03435 family)
MINVIRPGTALLFTLLAVDPASAQRIDLVDEVKLPRFEIVSVKPGDPRSDVHNVSFPPGRFVQDNMPLLNVVSLAFDARPSQLPAPLPDLITRELFSIDARMPLGTSAADLKLMLRALLIDRFKLRFHVDSREQDAYSLTMARRDGRLGPQLRSSRVDCMARMEAQRRNEAVPPQPEGSKACGLKGGAGVLDLGGMPMSALAQALSGPAGRQVVDKTGLTGSFDAELQYAPATGTRGPTDPAPPGSDGASLFTAVQEQLGLRLEPSKTSIDVLVIDHIERPMPD